MVRPISERGTAAMSEESKLKILELRVVDHKRVRVMHVKPDGKPYVEIAGKNRSGKSSGLDSIEVALCGKSAMDQDPIRHGAERAEIFADLGEYKITRNITPGSSGKFEVAKRDGSIIKRPQEVLDSLYSSLAGDPLRFSSTDDKGRLEILRKIVPSLDFSKDQSAYDDLYSQRTAIGKLAEAEAARAEGMPNYPEAPASPTSMTELVDKLDAARATVKRAQDAEAAVTAAKKMLDDRDADIGRINAQIEELKKKYAEGLEKRTAEAATLGGLIEAGSAAKAAVVDPEPIRAQMSEIDAINRKVAANKARSDAMAAADARRAKYREMTADLAGIKAKKVEALKAAKFPIEGLSVSEDGTVIFNDVPFIQASQAEKIRVGVAVACAENKRVAVMLVRDGSLLDSEGKRLLAEAAAERGAQVWVEVVCDEAKDASPGSIFFEDGVASVIPEQP